MAKKYVSYSKEDWKDLEYKDMRAMTDKQLRETVKTALKYTRMAYKNLVNTAGGSKASRELIGKPNFSEKGGKRGRILSATIVGKSRGELIEMLKAQQVFARSEVRTASGLEKWANNIRESLTRNRWTFHEGLTSSQLDQLFTMIDDIKDAFGTQGSPEIQVAEAISDYIRAVDITDMNYNDIKEEIISKIRSNEYDNINGHIIWLYE